MASYANRIRQLRERLGKSHAQVAAAIGINLPWYYDVEDHDDEVTTTLSLRQVYRLAGALGVTMRQLLATGDDFEKVSPERLTLADIAYQVQSKADVKGIVPVEDAVGWRLDHFLKDPASAWDEPADFLRCVCEFLGLDWIDAIPADPPADR